MKRILFGNPDTSYWKLAIDGASRRERIVVVDGELHAGFFVAATPMCIEPDALQRFAAAIAILDETLNGEAHLSSANEQSKVEWNLKALPLGHIESSGRFQINGNELRFTFHTDQTQLKPLRGWISSALFVFENSHDA
jgi:hypothetical protein